MPLDPARSPFLKSANFWRQQIELALTERRAREPWWDANLKAYAPRATDSPDGYGSSISTNRDFTVVERKGADLFYQRPEVTLQPTPLLEGPILDPQTGQPMTGSPDAQGQPGSGSPIPQAVALQAHEEIVNELLGPDEIDATRVAHLAIFDVLSTQGVGFTKMGYESVTVPQEQVDPLTGQPRTVPVPIHEQIYWQHFSGKKALVPHDLRSTDWDRAPWLGYQFELPLTDAIRQKYKLPPEFKGTQSDTRQYYDHGTGAAPAGQDIITGAELWYRSALYRSDIRHPEHLTHLVLVDGRDEAAIEEDSPDQTLDARGGLTPDSLIGFPIHPLHIRTLPDSAFPPSDCTMIRPLVNELNRSREQNIEYRDANTLRWQYNTDVLPADALSKIVRSPIGGMVGVPGEAYAGEGAIKPLPQGTMPRENFGIQDYIDQDIARTIGIDAAGAGVQSQTNQTATEAQIQQGNANARLDYERGVTLQWYIRGVTKISTYVQRYLPVAQAAQIVGAERARIWDAWRHTVPSALAFTAMPDSALRVDQSVDRKQAQELYSFLANDPYIAKGRAKLLEKLLRKFHIDPTGIVAPPDPAKPEPPKLSLSFKGEDLANPMVREVLAQQGVTISQQAVDQAMGLMAQQAAQAQVEADLKHGGKLAQQESLSKHAADQTGAMQNTGQPATLAPGGMVQ